MSEAENANREIWRERQGDFYSDNIFITENGQGIGIDCGGFVIVMPARDWHAIALNDERLQIVYQAQIDILRDAIIALAKEEDRDAISED